MKRGFFLLLTVLVVLLGCQSDNARDSGLEEASGEAKRGFGYYPGIGWIRGANASIFTNNNTQLLELTREAMKEERYTQGMTAAKFFIRRTPTADDVPEMRRVVAEVYESRGFDEYAFKEYQKLLDAHPGYEKTDEVAERMYEIATLYLNGKSFRWKLPWQETIYIPTGSSMGETSKLYAQIVGNAPYGAYAAQSQYGVGQAHERSLQGFWGFLASEAEYDKATRAYQLLVDRYSYRSGDKPRTDQEQINEMVAQARFRSAELFEKQANEGIYDQSMAERAISAYEDYKNIYEEDEARSEKVSEAKSRMNAMNLERARGLKSIALFYEKTRQWEAAKTYYGQINPSLYKDVLNDPEYQEETQSIINFASKRLDEELHRWRVIDSLEQYPQAQKHEGKNKIYSAQRFYRKVSINLRIPPNDMKKAAAAEGVDLDKLKQIKAAVEKDLERIQQSIDRIEIEERTKNQ